MVIFIWVIIYDKFSIFELYINIRNMESIKKFNEFTRNVNEKLFNNIENNKILLEISRVGFISKSPVLEIYIYTDDPGNIPHFHIRDYKKNGNSGEEFHTCIEFKTNRYFHHTGKEDILNKHQRKLLCDFLKKTEQDELESNWNILIKEWNRNNSNIKIPTNLPMPDYTTIEELLQTVYTDEMLLEMANISQKTTGLDVIVWVQTNNTQSTGKHNLPRIKFQNNTATKIQINELIPISISDDPKILLKNNDLNKIKISQTQINGIKQWIIKNEEILIDYWEEKITTDELFKKLKK